MVLRILKQNKTKQKNNNKKQKKKQKKKKQHMNLSIRLRLQTGILVSNDIYARIQQQLISTADLTDI